MAHRSCSLLSVALSLALLVCCKLRAAGAVTAVTPWEEGQASFYGGAPDGDDPYSPSFGTQSGSCGYGLLDRGSYPFWAVAGIATANHFYSSEPLRACGECFEVECLENGPLGSKPGSCQSDLRNRSVVVMITDSCPECSSNQLDLQALTWAKIATPSPGGGRVNIQFRRVECAPPSDLVIIVDSNSGSNGWIRLKVYKAGGPAPVQSVQIKSSSSETWQNMNNLWGASWEVGQQPTPPLDMRIIANNGASVTQKNCIPYNAETGTLQTHVQFKISDPSDVQPSGNTTNPANDTVNLTARQDVVQAFEGPPETALAQPPAPGTAANPVTNIATGGGEAVTSAPSSGGGSGSTSGSSSSPPSSPSPPSPGGQPPLPQSSPLPSSASDSSSGGSSGSPPPPPPPPTPA